jgi:hypothetical protein
VSRRRADGSQTHDLRPQVKNVTAAMPAHGDSQHECPARRRLSPPAPAGDGAADKKHARQRGARAGVAAAAAAFGAVLMLLESCSALVVTAGSGAALGRSSLRPCVGRGQVGNAVGLGPGGLATTVRRLRTDGSRAADVRCAISVAPNSIYSWGDWGLILPAATPEKRPSLPRLTKAELQQLHQGERVQRQSRVGPVGHGLVVMDVQADVSTVLAVLSDVQRYPQRIGTVREAIVQPGGSRNLCKARFKLSRFELDVQAELYLSKNRNMLEFRLDKSGGMQGAVFDEARGYWYLEACPEREEGWTRVWLNARVQCSPLLPSAVIDYAASKALPRASTWLAPVCEAVERELAANPLGAVYKDVYSLGLGLPLEYV